MIRINQIPRLQHPKGLSRWRLHSIERLVVTLIDDFNFEPKAAIEEAGQRLLVKKIER